VCNVIKYNNDSIREPSELAIETQGSMAEPLAKYSPIFQESCKLCAMKNYCCGISYLDYKFFGSGDIRAIKE